VSGHVKAIRYHTNPSYNSLFQLKRERMVHQVPSYQIGG